MILAWTSDAWDDYLYWQTADRQTLKRINKLIEDTMRDPFDGVGKPEPLKHRGDGAWSRRITEEHRLVYTTTDELLIIMQARFRY